MKDKSALLLDALLLSEALLWTLTLVGSMSFDILNESSDYVLHISHTPHAWYVTMLFEYLLTSCYRWEVHLLERSIKA